MAVALCVDSQGTVFPPLGGVLSGSMADLLDVCEGLPMNPG